MIVHIPVPTVEDVEFVAKVHSSDTLTAYYEKVLSSLKSLLAGRTSRLQEEFKLYGHNVYIGDDLTKVELLECFDAILSNNVGKYHELKARKFAYTATLIGADIAVIGANEREFRNVIEDSLESLFAKVETPRYTDTSASRNSMVGHFLQLSKTSVALTLTDAL